MLRISNNSLRLLKAFRVFKHLEMVNLSTENSNARIKLQVIIPSTLICNATACQFIQLSQPTTRRGESGQLIVPEITGKVTRNLKGKQADGLKAQLCKTRRSGFYPIRLSITLQEKKFSNRKQDKVIKICFCFILEKGVKC